MTQFNVRMIGYFFSHHLLMRMVKVRRRLTLAILAFLVVFAPGHRMVRGESPVADPKALPAEISPAAAFLEKQDLFKAGDDPAYNIYHIPGVVVTAKDTVLAWCEARKRPAGASDWDDVRILLRRSTDDGRTWSPPRSIADVPGPKAKNPAALRLKGVDPSAVTYNNPVLIADRDGTIHMLFCLEYMRCFYQRSADDGLTWSAPTEITSTFETFKKDYAWTVLATGPNHSIQLRTGRLIVPVWLSTGNGGNAHRPSVTATIYSDDQGKTWRGRARSRCLAQRNGSTRMKPSPSNSTTDGPC